MKIPTEGGFLLRNKLLSKFIFGLVLLVLLMLTVDMSRTKVNQLININNKTYVVSNSSLKISDNTVNQPIQLNVDDDDEGHI